uniref:Uncharacterized protein n=1 Tax=Phaeomonas parva TaxID=124430 RepID=A0A7S1TRL8_9STRA|mmetsp:Transcript_14677/g.44095  ORF Transcript_14677/g.44095 Transcript_14677/m.44095 type:complete len:219 (+) Transcript_14677:64-720(+)
MEPQQALSALLNEHLRVPEKLRPLVYPGGKAADLLDLSALFPTAAARSAARRELKGRAGSKAHGHLTLSADLDVERRVLRVKRFALATKPQQLLLDLEGALTKLTLDEIEPELRRQLSAAAGIGEEELPAFLTAALNRAYALKVLLGAGSPFSIVIDGAEPAASADGAVAQVRKLLKAGNDEGDDEGDDDDEEEEEEPKGKRAGGKAKKANKKRRRKD